MIVIKLLGLLALVAIAAGSVEERIIGGVPPRPGQAAHLVFVHTQFNRCDGALLSNRWAITAARCLLRVNANHVTLGIGSTNRTDGTWYRARALARHPKFNAQTNAYNIALVHTINPITLIPGRVQPAALPRQPLALPSKVWTVGFSRRGPSGSNIHVRLSVIQSMALSREVCLKRIYVGMKRMFHVDHVCAQPVVKRTGTCRGDVGVPLTTAQNVLVGLNVWASSCGGERPDVYILIHPNIDFIRRATGIQN